MNLFPFMCVHNYMMTNSEHNDIQEVINKVSIGFVFGHNTLEDIRQQCWVYVMEKFHLWDRARPLKSYIYTVLRSRLINFKRDTYKCAKKPCDKCPFFAKGAPSECLQFQDKLECSKYSDWVKNNKAKMNLNYLNSADGADRAIVGDFARVETEDVFERVFSQLEPDEADLLNAFLNSSSRNLKPIRALIPKIRSLIENE